MARVCGHGCSACRDGELRNARELREARPADAVEQLWWENRCTVFTLHPREAASEPYCLPYAAVRALAELVIGAESGAHHHKQRSPSLWAGGCANERAPAALHTRAPELLNISQFRYRLVIEQVGPLGFRRAHFAFVRCRWLVLRRVGDIARWLYLPAVKTQSPMLRLVVGALLLVLAFAGGYAVAACKTVTLTVDGTAMRATT